VIPALALGAVALASPKVDEAESCLETKLSDLWREGVRSRSVDSTTLKVGQTQETYHLLFGGFEVTFRACAGKGATNLDLLLVDDEGNIVTRDASRSGEPDLTFTPQTTARYRLVTYLQAAEASVGEAAVPVAVALTFSGS